MLYEDLFSRIERFDRMNAPWLVVFADKVVIRCCGCLSPRMGAIMLAGYAVLVVGAATTALCIPFTHGDEVYPVLTFMGTLCVVLLPALLIILPSRIVRTRALAVFTHALMSLQFVHAHEIADQSSNKVLCGDDRIKHTVVEVREQTRKREESMQRRKSYTVNALLVNIGMEELSDAGALLKRSAIKAKGVVSDVSSMVARPLGLPGGTSCVSSCESLEGRCSCAGGGTPEHVDSMPVLPDATGNVAGTVAVVDSAGMSERTPSVPHRASHRASVAVATWRRLSLGRWLQGSLDEADLLEAQGQVQRASELRARAMEQTAVRLGSVRE